MSDELIAETDGSSDGLYDEIYEKRIIDGLAEFAAGAGHELNNPLAIISVSAQNLLREETDRKKRSTLANIVAQTQRAYEMIADIRSFARPPKPELKSFNIVDMFQAWVRRESQRAVSENAKIETLVSVEQEIELTSDESMLTAILDSLGKNAAEATSARKGALFFFMALKNAVESNQKNIGYQPTGQYLEIGIEDDGPGLSSEDMQLVFAPYYSGRQAGRGLGFGLSKAWRFSEALGIRLSCERAIRFETGCRWSIQIPIE